MQMGLGSGAMKAYLELWQRGFFKEKKSIAEMGSQEIHLKKDYFENLLARAGLSNYKKENFRNLELYPGFPRVSAKAFYETLGIDSYTCVDVNGDHQAIKIDLNIPLEDRSLYGKFDIVTDHGTNEHVFNVAEAYRTLHRLCRNGGIISIIQSVYKGNGYYLFDQSFFDGLAAANNYRVLFSSYVVTLADEQNIYDQFHIPASAQLIEALDWSKLLSIEICYVFQKQSGEDFAYPYQGKYLSQIQKNMGYQLQFLSAPPSYGYVPIFSGNLEDTEIRTLAAAIFKKLGRKLRKIIK